MRVLFVFLPMVFFFSEVFCQFTRTDTIAFSGMVLEGDSLNSLEYVHIFNQHNQGTITNANGGFSFQVSKHDTLTFSSVGFERFMFVIPDTLRERNYVTAIVLHKANILLSEVLILPWMNRAEFRQAFIQNQPPPEQFNAQRNINTAAYVAQSTPAAWNNDMVIKQQLAAYAYDVETRGLITGNTPGYINITGMAWAMLGYIYQMSNKNEQERKMKEQLRMLLKNREENIDFINRSLQDSLKHEQSVKPE